jgi:RND family efflux transporter MFP subunit
MTTTTDEMKSRAPGAPAVGADGHGASDQPGHRHAVPENEVPKNLPRPGLMTGLVLAVAVVAAIAGLFVLGWFPHLSRENQANADAAAQSSQQITVSVTRPKPTAVTKDLWLPCDVRANQSTAIYPQANGYLQTLKVDIQDHVEEGQLLAVISTPEVDAQLEEARATLQQAQASVKKSQADLDLADKTLKRYVDAQNVSTGSVSATDLDTKKAAYDDAEAALVQSKATVVQEAAEVERLKVLQGFERIIAPFSGTITARNYDLGALLPSTSNLPLFNIEQTDTLRVFISVPQSDSTNVRTNQAAYLVVKSYPDRQFTGTVTRTAGAIDPATRTLNVEVDFPNRDGALYAGMYGSVHLPLSDTRPTLTIPTSGLIFNADGLRVALVKDGKIHMQSIGVGHDLGTEIEVTSGIGSDDLVVANPGELVQVGLAVILWAPPEPAAPAGARQANAAR